MSEYKNMWRNFFNFSDRATVRDYWMAWLVNLVIITLLGWLAPKVHLGIIPFFYGLVSFTPMVSLAARRLNDSGKNWYYLFIGLIPIVGTLVLAVLLCMPTKRHTEPV